ncbi:MAG: uridine kinase [Bacteroidetes bacterium CG2_30_33_31]|nr:MAG: uridine kinase [Bacteroidetes bacterium CG2_30_33_31]
MLGDVLLIEDKHRKAGEIIVNEIIKNKKTGMTVAISGESGTGKTELAHVIAKGLRAYGIFAKAIHIDNYYRILPLERTEWRQKNGIENVVGYDEYDWQMIYKNISDFKNKAFSTMPCVDLVTEQVDLLTTNFADIDMLIIDGLYAIKTENIDMKIFIDLTYHDTGKAQKLRGKEPQNEYRMKVLLKEHDMVANLKKEANVIISKDYQVNFL